MKYQYMVSEVDVEKLGEAIDQLPDGYELVELAPKKMQYQLHPEPEPHMCVEVLTYVVIVRKVANLQ